ncbi:VOC family protein [Georgenia deserti]|uniref:VOC family protein n=1 Tax=Georgenia deserti TaxID=2093781 RepID=A0ABW4L8C1_9MICO
MQYVTGFTGFSVADTERARAFYRDVLDLEVRDAEMPGLLELHLPGGTGVLVYPKAAAHTPASFTVLNLTVPDIDAAVRDLTSRGVTFLQYHGDLATDETGVHRGTPTLAWFTDPDGNIISLIEEPA